MERSEYKIKMEVTDYDPRIKKFDMHVRDTDHADAVLRQCYGVKAFEVKAGFVFVSKF